MSTSVYQTFQDIYEAVIRDAKESTSTVAVVDLVKRWINEGYEIVNYRKHRTYLDKRFVISVVGCVSDTFSVTEGSSIVYQTGTETLPSTSLELGFKAEGNVENYEIASLVQGSAIVLTTTYKGESNSAATSVVYQRSVILDSSISEVYQVWHNYFQGALENIGPQRMQNQMLWAPNNYDKATQFAIFGQDATLHAKRLVLWPYPDADYTIYLDTNIYFDELTMATDEPLIPPQDRQILYWYGLSKLFGTYHRNAESGGAALATFNTWLIKLDGKEDVSQDNARLIIDYRRPRRWIGGRAFDSRERDEP